MASLPVPLRLSPGLSLGVIMRKENEFGGVYYQMNFSRDDLEDILFAMRDREGHFRHVYRGNIIDRIEKELGIE
jgi:hypothetical protein